MLRTEYLHFVGLIYNFALVCAFFKIGSMWVAFMTSPLIFSFPDINNACAFAFPLTSFPKSSSAKVKDTT